MARRPGINADGESLGKEGTYFVGEQSTSDIWGERWQGDSQSK